MPTAGSIDELTNISDPGRTRTFDPQLRRLLLYPLSYEARRKKTENLRKVTFFSRLQKYKMQFIIE
jgi:hypothetical protein